MHPHIVQQLQLHVSTQKRQRDRQIHIDAHEPGSVMVHGQGSHGGADRRALDERDQAAHEQKARHHQRDLDVGHMNRTDEEASRRKQVRRVGLDRGAPDELGSVLKQEGHAERGDQDRQQ